MIQYKEFKKFIETKSAYKVTAANEDEQRFTLANNHGKQFDIHFSFSYDEAMRYIKANGIRKFYDDMMVGSSLQLSKPSKAGKISRKKAAPTKSREDVDHTPITLKKRELAAAQAPIPKISNSEDTSIPEVTTHTTAAIVEQYNAVEIDYEVKAPRNHNGYYFPQFTANILTRLKIGRNVLLTGPTGTGKSEFVVRLGEYMGQRVVRVNLSIGTTEGHLIGKFVAKNGATQFVYGIVPIAMKLGWWLLLDEIDYAQPEHLAVLQPILEGDNLLIVQNENEEVKPHKNFRVFATANTKGRGDETQSYVGTNFLNMAFLDRWSIFELEYTKQEPKIVENILSADPTLASQLNQFFSMLRKAIDSGELTNMAFSTRRLEQVAEMLAFGEPINDVLEYELFSRYDKHEVEVMREFAYEVWDKAHYFGGWAIGEKHFAKEVV